MYNTIEETGVPATNTDVPVINTDENSLSGAIFTEGTRPELTRSNILFNQYVRKPAFYVKDHKFDTLKTLIKLAVFGLSIAFLAAFAFNPALIPAAIALVGFWANAAAVALAGVVAAGTGYSLFAKPLLNLHRAEKLDAVQQTVLGLTAATGVASLATVSLALLAPAYLPFGLAAVASYSAWIQLAIAAPALPAAYATAALHIKPKAWAVIGEDEGRDLQELLANNERSCLRMC